MKHQLVAIILGLGVTLLGFQNCSSKVSFSTKDSDLTAKSGPFEEDNQEMGLPVVPDGDTILNDDVQNPPDLGDGTPPSNQNPPPVIITDNNDNNPNDDSDHDSSGNNSNNDNDSDDDNSLCIGQACVDDEVKHDNEHNCKRKEHHHRHDANHRNHEENDDDHHQDKRGYVCILDSSPGKSIRLGIISQSLEAVGSTPQTVCISKNACENIASKVFSVAGASKRGFCHDNRNPHVVQLTDEQVQTLIDKILDK